MGTVAVYEGGRIVDNPAVVFVPSSGESINPAVEPLSARPR